MNIENVLRRIACVPQRPQLLDTVVQDVGVALARGERTPLAEVARELAAHAPDKGGGEGYWAGVAAGIGMLLASYEAAHENFDARAAAMRVTSSESARAVILRLARGPATGAELSQTLGVTAGAVSKVLASMRSAGLVRIVGTQPDGADYPKRGARKPHVLTPLGASVAEALALERTHAPGPR